MHAVVPKPQHECQEAELPQTLNLSPPQVEALDWEVKQPLLAWMPRSQHEGLHAEPQGKLDQCNSLEHLHLPTAHQQHPYHSLAHELQLPQLVE